MISNISFPPAVIQYCVSVIGRCHRENRFYTVQNAFYSSIKSFTNILHRNVLSLSLSCRLTDPLLTASLKTTMTILHKTQSALCSLLAGTSCFQFHSTHTIDCAVTWPVDLGGQSAEVKGHWVAGLLERAAGVCEDLLKTGQRRSRLE